MAIQCLFIWEKWMARASTASKPRIDRRLVIALVSLIAVLFYLSMSALIFRVGFPLDDTWIHLTYARNFAGHGEWAFRLGEQSAGSTAPLWTFLLSLGYFLKLAPYIWTFFLGWVVLTALGISAESVARRVVGTYNSPMPWAGIFFVVAWHLTWSAVSGMETLLHGLFTFIVLSGLIAGSRRYLALGFIIGLSVWVRPDGLTLLGPLLVTALLVEKPWSSRGTAILKIVMGFGALFLPYLLFNLALSGNPMPNTFYAKQAEYEAVWLSKPFLDRVNEYLAPIIASPFLVLFPGAVIWIYKMILSRNWGALAGVIWFFGYLAIYFMRLPAYQHGRYIIPALPILYLWGMIGFLAYITSIKAKALIKLLWQMSLGVLCLLFAFLAARQNAHDVYWIESEMVETAKWVQANIPPDALLAVHDIGALGYYVPNPIVDLAGLITPEVVPFIRDEARLAGYLMDTSSDYLIVFRNDYPNLTEPLSPVYVAGQEPGPIGFENDMHVFRLK
jgi:hypothetical protein